MDMPKDISYCFGRPNTLWEIQCVKCERYLKIHDFKNQVFTMANLSPKDESKCEIFYEKKK